MEREYLLRFSLDYLFLNQVKEQSKIHQKQILFVLEYTNANGYTLSKIINQYGYITPQLIKREPKETVHCDKNALIDTQRVAKVMLLDRKKLNKFVYSDKIESANELKVLLMIEKLWRKITGLKNQLHVFLHKIFENEYEQEVSKLDIFCKYGLKQWRYLLS